MHVVAPTGETTETVTSQGTAVYCGVLGKYNPCDWLITNVNTPPPVEIGFKNHPYDYTWGHDSSRQGYSRKCRSDIRA